MKIQISDDIINKCKEFADKSVNSNSKKYLERNKSSIEKITNDIMIGKIGEEVVYSVLSKYDLTQPDYNVYDKKDKNWSPDLRNETLSVAVKTQNIQSAKKYGESWVFQYNFGKNFDCDKEVFKKSNDNHFAAFVLLDLKNKIGEVKAILKINWLHENDLFKPMKLAHLQGNKVAVYYEDLISYKEELFQL